MIENTPFTFEEAGEICEDFEDLVDTEFTLPSSGINTVFMVDAVAICPFGEAQKAQFLNRYQETRNITAAIEGYDGPDYDVILLLSDADNEADFSYLGIRTFVAEKGITYNFPSL